MNREASQQVPPQTPGQQDAPDLSDSMSNALIQDSAKSPATPHGDVGETAPAATVTATAMQVAPPTSTPVSTLARPVGRAQAIGKRSEKPQEPPRDIYQEALRALRGRYALAIVLALMGAAGGVATV